jgi:peptidoglycan hydrolase CwlO-like protein
MLRTVFMLLIFFATGTTVFAQTYSSDDTISSGTEFNEDLVIDSGARLTINENIVLSVHGNISFGLGGGTIYLAGMNSRLICSGTLMIVDGPAVISVPAGYISPPTFTSVSTGGNPFRIETRAYQPHLEAVVNDAGAITIRAYQTFGNRLVSGAGSESSALDSANYNLLVSGGAVAVSWNDAGTPATSDDCTGGMCTATVDASAVTPNSVYEISLTVNTPSGEQEYVHTSVAIPASGGVSYATNMQAWWDEENDKIRIRSWMAADGSVLGEPAGTSVSGSMYVNGTSVAPAETSTASYVTYAKDLDLDATYVRGGTYAVVASVTYDSNTTNASNALISRYAMATVYVPPIPSKTYAAKLQATYNVSTDNINMRAMLLGDGVVQTGIALANVRFDCSSAVATNEAATSGLADGVYVLDKAAAVGGVFYLVRVSITAPDGNVYSDIVNLSVDTASAVKYEARIAASGKSNGTVDIETHILEEGALFSYGATPVITVNGAVIPAGSILTTADHYTTTYTGAAGTIYDIRVAYTIGASTYTAVIKVTTPESAAGSTRYDAHLSAVYRTTDGRICLRSWVSADGAVWAAAPDPTITFSPAGPAVVPASVVSAGGVYTAEFNTVTADTVYHITATTGSYTTYATVYTAAASDVSALSAKIDTLDDKVDDVQTDVTGLVTDVGDIKTAVDDTKADTTVLLSDTATIKSSTNGINTMVAAAQAAEYAASSGFLNRETSVRTGTSVTFRYRTASGLTPTLDVYDPADTKIVSAVAMSELGTTGVYQYAVTFAKSWGLGQFSAVISESTRSTKDGMTVSVVAQDLSTISGDLEQVTTDVRAVAGSVSKVEDRVTEVTASMSAVSNLDMKFGAIAQSVSDLTAGVSEQKKFVMSMRGDMDKAYNSLAAISKELQGLGALQKVGLDKLAALSDTGKDDMKYIRNKTEEMKAALDLSQKLIDDMANEPVVEVWYEFK